MKRHLKTLSWKNGNLYDRVISWEEKVKVIQCKVDADPNNVGLKEEEAEIMKEYNDDVKDEESFLCQQAKIDWLKEGDKNNKFFHAVLRGKNHRSRINMVNNEDGIMFEGNSMPEQFVIHFQKFLGFTILVKKIEYGDLNLKFRVSVEEAKFMVRKVNNEEIKAAIFDIDDNKAPGPDGYTSKFFKKSWNVVKKDV
ncbi:hypothetical protein Tco_0201923 [Tanacetum coccineum]